MAEDWPRVKCLRCREWVALATLGEHPKKHKEIL